jgi:hypothetical protein
MTPKDIAEALDRTHGSTKVLLSSMTKAGEIIKTGYGRYVGADVLSPNSAYPANSANPLTPLTLSPRVSGLGVRESEGEDTLQAAGFRGRRARRMGARA